MVQSVVRLHSSQGKQRRCTWWQRLVRGGYGIYPGERDMPVDGACLQCTFISIGNDVIDFAALIDRLINVISIYFDRNFIAK